ncbi:MAG: hypothetical protein KDE27_26805, partial [Planctomycetes bacterium]|nr:hypothetical protein [Planctomycetota bacterium]
MTHFVPSAMPDEGLGVLLLIRIVEQNTPGFFAPDRPVHVARAPGRLDLLGGVGGGERALALQLPTSEAVCAAVQTRDDEMVRIWSPCRDGARTDRLSVRLGDLGLPDAPIDDQEARAFLCADPRDAWIAHVLGGVLVLARDHRKVVPNGFDLLLTSDLPEQSGAGSSAAVQVATLRAVAHAFGLELDADELVAVCRTIDSEIVRDDLGGLPQRTIVGATAGALAALRGDAGAPEAIAVPDALEFVGLDLGMPIVTATVADAADVAAENARAERFVELLRQPVSPATATELGELMF